MASVVVITSSVFVRVSPMLLFTGLSPEKDVPYCAEEIADVREYRMLQACLDVAPFRGLHLLNRLGRLAVIVERWEQPRFHLGAQRLHLWRIEAKVLLRQRPHPY